MAETSGTCKLSVADIVTAFDERTVGSKVIDHSLFMKNLISAIENFDWQTCNFPGQAYIELPINSGVSSGNAKRSDNPEDYVVRKYRDRIRMFLKRPAYNPVTHLAVVVYTLDAYLNDPDVSKEEFDRISGENPSHVLVAVLASSGKPAKMSVYTFVRNLAGANNEAMIWTADEIREKAKEIIDDINDSFMTVSD